MSLVSRKFKITQLRQKQILFRLFSRSSTTSQVADVQIDNSKAIKLINYLYVNNTKRGKGTYKTVEKALDIYDKITDAPNYETIDNLLQLFFNYGHPNQYVSVWNDIETIQSIHHKQHGLISYPMLLKCCIQSVNINTNDCIQVLTWIKHSNFTLTIKEKYINKLIIHCSKQYDIQSLDFIYKLFNDGCIDCDPILIKTTFITAYSICNYLSKSVDIFNGINDDELNMICVGTMLKMYINHEYYADALQLYDRIHAIAIQNENIQQNDYCDSMALQACIKSDNMGKAKTIHENVNKKLYDKGKSELEMNEHVKHSLIGLYAHFGDIKEAERLFHSMRNNHCNCIALNHMMNGYINKNDNESALGLYKYALEKNELSNILAITACSNTKNYILGKKIYSDIKIKNYQINLKQLLIRFFGECSEIKLAENIFHSINDQRMDIITIGNMMRMYIDNGYNNDALQLYDSFIKDHKNKYIEPIENKYICDVMALKASDV